MRGSAAGSPQEQRFNPWFWEETHFQEDYEH